MYVSHISRYTSYATSLVHYLIEIPFGNLSAIGHEHENFSNPHFAYDIMIIQLLTSKPFLEMESAKEVSSSW